MKKAKHRWRGFGDVIFERGHWPYKVVREFRQFRCTKCGAVIKAEASAKIPRSVWESMGIKDCDEQVVQGVMSM